jgi:squalene synthase HpnC
VSVGHYENFPVASKLVPARYRRAVVAIYRFARAADDLADEGDASPQARLAALADFDAALAAIGRGESPAAAPFPELAAAIRAHALPLAPFHDLVSAFRQDVSTIRYASFGDLHDYCTRSANPVGRLLLALYGIESPAALAASDSICTGLQLANFWQDVAADWRRGRVYLPQEDLARFGVDEAQIAAGRTDERWRALLAFETARARALLAAGRPLCRALRWRLGLELSAVIAGGTRILDRIDAVAGDVFRRRPELGVADWIAVGYRALVPGRPRNAAAAVARAGKP